MTTDLAQQKYTLKATLGPISKNLPLELTRDESFLSGEHDIFDILARTQTKDFNPLEPGRREFGVTLGLLERAKNMLRSAENVIQAKDERITSLETRSEYCTLTGLLNARGFKNALTREVARTNRGLNEGGLLVIFNLENYDHIIQNASQAHGHEALRLVARALVSETRDMDYAARVNESEFVILFAETSMEHALSRLQNMALRLNRLSLNHPKGVFHISLSLGLKNFTQGAMADQILRSANMDLQRNRKGARSQAQSA